MKRDVSSGSYGSCRIAFTCDVRAKEIRRARWAGLGATPSLGSM